MGRLTETSPETRELTDRAIIAARDLERHLALLYAARERNDHPLAGRLGLLERIVENCATHPAFAKLS